MVPGAGSSVWVFARSSSPIEGGFLCPTSSGRRVRFLGPALQRRTRGRNSGVRGRRSAIGLRHRVQTLEMIRPCVVRPAEYPQVFPAATLDPGLQQASATATDEVSRFDDHSLVAYLHAFQPPSHGLGAILGGLQLHHANIGRCQDGGVGSHEPTQSLEVPVVGVHTSFAGQQMERRETQILYGIYWGWFWIVRLYPRGLFPDGNRPWRSRRRTTAR